MSDADRVELERQITSHEEMCQQHGKREVFVLGIAGGTASGKTTVCNTIMSELKDHRVKMICQDSFYKVLTPEQIEQAHKSEFDFDHPDAFDHELLHHVLSELKKGNRVEVPIYDFATHSRKEETLIIDPPDVLLVEGILVFFDEVVRSTMNLKVFVDTDSDTRLARRLVRDTAERGRTVDGVLAMYNKFVKPSFEKFVDPTKRHANLILPWNGGNPQAVQMIVENVRTKLRQHDLKKVYPNVDVFSSSHFQVRALHTLIRDVKTPREQFVFYCDRLIRLVVEEALGHLPFSESRIQTECNQEYMGTQFKTSICGVSIIRSGEAMETALRACCKDIRIGKLLVRKIDPTLKSPERSIVHAKLPKDISNRSVLLLDPIAHSGHTAMAAVRYLIDEHKVPASKIIFVNVITARPAITLLCKEFPDLQLITTAIDEVHPETGKMIPGCPVNFADKYFGTDY